MTARLEGRDLGSAMDEIKARLFKEIPFLPLPTSNSAVSIRSSTSHSSD